MLSDENLREGHGGACPELVLTLITIPGPTREAPCRGSREHEGQNRHGEGGDADHPPSPFPDRAAPRFCHVAQRLCAGASYGVVLAARCGASVRSRYCGGRDQKLAVCRQTTWRRSSCVYKRVFRDASIGQLNDHLHSKGEMPSTTPRNAVDATSAIQ